jgi:hypothetical protein
MMIPKSLIRGLVVSLGLVYTGMALGAMNAEEATQLGTVLTGVGAERAGNKEGTIPAYTGGITTPPKEYQPNSGVRPDPFAHEKPLFSIDAQNLEPYADRLTEGVKTLMKKYPTFRIDVYPTHRSVGFPEWVLDGTKKGATRATTTNDGLILKDAQGGLPFPIPKSGYEAMWNHLTTYIANPILEGESWYVDSSGRPVMGDKGITYYDNSEQWDPRFNGQNDYYFTKAKYFSTGPPRRTGLALLCHNPVNWVKLERPCWFYLPGQRRLRLASDLSYDLPNDAVAGMCNLDDIHIFNGAMDRFDFKIIAKKEMYVPYNCYKATYFVDEKELLGAHHLNPDHLRWELHRVWVVEGRLKEGKRHNYSLRRYYLDEDSWLILAADIYDLQGKLYRVGFGYLTQSYDVKAPNHQFCGFYDLESRNYFVSLWPSKRGKLTYFDTPDPRDFSPEALTGGGVR